MAFPEKATVDALKKVWTDKFVRIHPSREEFKRFDGRVGRVVTINYSGRAVVDFADGAWYDIPDFEKVLEIVEDAAHYDPSANSAQQFPARQS